MDKKLVADRIGNLLHCFNLKGADYQRCADHATDDAERQRFLSIRDAYRYCAAEVADLINDAAETLLAAQ